MVPMPEEMKMRIDLVDGWQNQRKTIRPYPLGREDRKVLDKVHDKLMSKESSRQWTSLRL